MKQRRGFGFLFRPTYPDKRTGERRTADTWWVSYPNRGKQVRENAHTTSETIAAKLLKRRTGEVGLGLPVGPQLERTTLGDLLKLVEEDYKANSRHSTDRVLQAGAHLQEHFGASRKTRNITTDTLTAYKARRLEVALCLQLSTTNWPYCGAAFASAGIRCRHGPISKCSMSITRARASSNANSTNRYYTICRST